MKTYSTVREYIADQPPAARKMISKLRSLVKAHAPQAEEGISYGMVGYKWNGVLLYIGAFREHCSLFALPGAMLHFKEELKDYKTSKGTLQFPLDEPLPEKLIARIIKFRLEENMKKASVKKIKKSGK